MGAAFALWAAPFVVARINPSQTPAQLALPLDWRVTLFAALLTFAVAFVCAFAPSLRVSEVEPAQAHKGEERQSRGRLTKPFDIAKQVTAEMSFMTAIGIGAGLAVGFATVRFIANLLYEVKSTDPSMTITPILVIAATVVAAALPAVIRAVRIDPASMLRVE